MNTSRETESRKKANPAAVHLLSGGEMTKEQQARLERLELAAVKANDLARSAYLKWEAARDEAYDADTNLQVYLRELVAGE